MRLGQCPSIWSFFFLKASLSPNLWIERLKTFDLDLDFDLTIVDIEINTRTTAPNLGKRHT